MRRAFYLSHPQVAIDPDVAVPDWRLSETGAARLRAFARSGLVPTVARIVSSAERKARETAAIVAEPSGCTVEVDPAMGEIDRSSTGYVPHDLHEDLADRLFGVPDESASGWERAVDAQARIVAAADRHLATGRDILFVGHGGVGTLWMCHVAGWPISRKRDQPAGGGCLFAVAEGRLVHTWRPIEAVSAGSAP